MKTTRTVLLSVSAVIASVATAFALTNLSLPVDSLFEYGVGSLVAAGLLAMSIGTERTTLRLPATRRDLAAPPRRISRPARTSKPPRRTFAHAA